MKNDYEIRGDVTAIFLKSPKYGEMETLIDTVDLEKVISIPAMWTAYRHPDVDSFYIIATFSIGPKKRKSVIFHRLIMDSPKGLYIDHINHDTLDNRKSCNLRATTSSENQQNRKGTPKNSKSGIMGVHWHSSQNKWRGQLKINKKVIYVGLYSDIKDAEIAIKEARAKYMPYSKEALSS